MKHKLLFVFLFFIVCIVLPGCNLSAESKDTYNNNTQNNEKLSDNNANFREQESELIKEYSNYLLIVNGVTIDTDSSLILNYYETYAELPLCSIIEALGGKTKWLNDDEIEIIVKEKVFYLNPYKLELFYSGNKKVNLFKLVTGHDHPIYRRVSGNEFIIDSDSIAFFFVYIDEAIRINYGNATVEIYYYEREFDAFKHLRDSESQYPQS